MDINTLPINKQIIYYNNKRASNTELGLGASDHFLATGAGGAMGLSGRVLACGRLAGGTIKLRGRVENLLASVVPPALMCFTLFVCVSKLGQRHFLILK